MATLDDEIDALYQLPLAEFTASRNALAKRAGRTDPPIKDLEKPSVAAWAVNQLYWHERPVYERLIETAERLRAEHRKLLAGKPSEIREAEKAHRDAIRAATETVRRIVTGSAQAASAATMVAVGETLEALPAAEAPGRLTHPLRPMGFEALAGVAVRAVSPPRLRLVTRPAEMSPPASPPSAKEAAAEAKRAAAAARRDATAARRAAEARKRQAEKEAVQEAERQRAAEAERRSAEEAVERAVAAYAEAEQELDRRREERDAAREVLRKLRRATV